MIVLKVIGILLLAILVLGIGLAALLMCLPARIEVRRRMPDGPLRVRIGFGPVRRACFCSWSLVLLRVRNWHLSSAEPVLLSDISPGADLALPLQ